MVVVAWGSSGKLWRPSSNDSNYLYYIFLLTTIGCGKIGEEESWFVAAHSGVYGGMAAWVAESSMIWVDGMSRVASQRL